MSTFLIFSFALLIFMLVIGWRVGWLTQLFWYALFGLFLSGFLLLLDELESIYIASGVSIEVAGLTAALTIIVFSALLVVPAIRVHKIFYTRKEAKEEMKQPGGAFLGAIIALLIIYSLGKSLMRYELIQSDSEAYQSFELRIIRAIDGNETVPSHQPKTFRPEQ